MEKDPRLAKRLSIIFFLFSFPISVGIFSPRMGSTRSQSVAPSALFPGMLSVSAGNLEDSRDCSAYLEITPRSRR
jgi:hypothetical protein